MYTRNLVVVTLLLPIALLIWIEDGPYYVLGLLCVAAGNYVLYKLDLWTAHGDQLAVRHGLRTGGWGADPNAGWFTGRLRVDREVKAAEQAQASRTATPTAQR